MKKVLSTDICKDIRPSYPILIDDKPGISINNINKDKRILLYPLLETSQIKQNKDLFNYWTDKCGTNANNKSRLNLNDVKLHDDIIKLHNVLGIHNVKYVDETVKNNVNKMCNILNTNKNY